jgi:dTDP-4-dehydrorhamnose reductase
MTPVIVTGATGVLGRALIRRLADDPTYRAVPWTRKDVDLTSIGAVTTKLQNTGSPVLGAVLVNCAGAIPQSGATAHQMVEANALVPHVLAAACAASRVAMIHISTDCVFGHPALARERLKQMRIPKREPGRWEHVRWTEWDIPCPMDLYGMTKAAGEHIAGALVIRTSFISREAGLWRWALDMVAAKQAWIPGWLNATWTGSTVEAVADLIVRRALPDAEAGETGVRHMATSEVMNKNDLLRWMVVGTGTKVFNVLEPVMPRALEPTSGWTLASPSRGGRDHPGNSS